MRKKAKGLLLAFALGVQMLAPAAVCGAADDDITVVQCENMTIGGQYAGKTYYPLTGVALYANNDKCSYTQYFASGTHDFTLRGAANNSSKTAVDLKIGGQTKGTFYFSGTSATEYTISNVTHGTGNQTIELVVTTDNGSWDVYVDELTITASGAGSTDSGTTGSGSTGSGSGTTDAVTETKVECEKMTLSGQYAGSISSPFSGVALYANNDMCSFTHNFTGTSSDFTLRGAANASVTASVDLKIGGQMKGTFKFTSAGAAVSTLSNVSHGTGNQTVELVVTTDNGSWDVYVDYLTISAAGSSSGSSGSGSGSSDSGSDSTGSGTTGSGSTVTVPSAAIPDPFVLNSGKVVSGMGDWQTRAEEIRDLYEENMYGVWRDGSDEQVTYSYSNGSLTINVRRLSTGKTTSFKATVNLPSGSSWNPAGGYPVIVGMHEGISEDTATANGYAVITIDGYSYPVASDDTSHKGAFYDLYPYGSSASEQTGVLMAWAWGASKVLDALEAGAGDLLNINEENSIITGVSRWGKAASVCGAFETRFKMVAPSCSGAGGLAMFRYTSEGKTYDFSSKGASSSYTYGQNEPLGSLQSTSERGWFNNKFLTYSSVNQLPFDQHYLASLAADSDRYLFIIGSCISEDWVNAPAMWFTYLATKEVYDYLGISDNIKINIHKEGHAVIEEDVKYMIQYFNQKVYGIQPGSDLSVLDTSVFALPQNWDLVWDTFNASWSVK